MGYSTVISEEEEKCVVELGASAGIWHCRSIGVTAANNRTGVTGNYCS